MREILAQIGLSAVTAIGKMQLIELLNKIKDGNPSLDFVNTLKGLHSSFSLLRDLAIKSKSKIDDGIVNMVLDAVAEVAEANDVKL